MTGAAEAPASRPGPWSAFERAAYDTCEPDVAAWLTHPGETLSGLAGLAAAVVVRHAAGGLRPGAPARLLPAILALIAAFSMLFHASFAAVFQRLDLAAIPLLTGLLAATAAVHGGRVRRERWPALFALFAGSGAVAPFVATAAGYAVVTAHAAALLLAWRGLARTHPAIRGDLWRTVALLLPAAALLGLGHAGIACVGARSAWTHVVQPHIVWHLASAAACVFIARIECALEREAGWSAPGRTTTRPAPAAAGTPQHHRGR